MKYNEITSNVVGGTFGGTNELVFVILNLKQLVTVFFESGLRTKGYS